MSKKTVLVMLSSYNGEKYIEQQIRSILAQRDVDVYLRIRDDGSVDDTKSIIKQLFAEFPGRIELIEGENIGLNASFFALIGTAEGFDYYAISDQDDYWLPEKAEKSLEKLNQQNADLVFGDLDVVDKSLETIYPSFNDYMLLTRKINKYIDSYKVNYLYNCVTGCTVLAKKETVKKILPLPTNSKYLIHDHWIGLMVSLNGKLAYMPEKYIKYRQHGNNQVGTEKISHGFKKLEQVRELFIDVKLGVFGTYVKNKEKFPKELQKQNEDAYEYFKMLTKKKYFNFRGWTTFHKLYKTETFKYYIENFMIMNMPVISKGIFNIRYFILKLMGKR